MADHLRKQGLSDQTWIDETDPAVTAVTARSWLLRQTPAQLRQPPDTGVPATASTRISSGLMDAFIGFLRQQCVAPWASKAGEPYSGIDGERFYRCGVCGQLMDNRHLQLKFHHEQSQHPPLSETKLHRMYRRNPVI